MFITVVNRNAGRTNVLDSMNCVDQEILGSQVENVGGTICCQTEDQGNVTPMVGVTRLYFHYFLPVM